MGEAAGTRVGRGGERKMTLGDVLMIRQKALLPTVLQ